MGYHDQYIDWIPIEKKVDAKLKKSGVSKYIKNFGYSGDTDVDTYNDKTNEAIDFSTGIYGEMKGGTSFGGRVFVQNRGRSVGVRIQDRESEIVLDLDDKDALDKCKRIVERKRNEERLKTFSTFVDPFKQTWKGKRRR